MVSLHFVALVVVDGQLWELDGRKSGPVPHGSCSSDSLLQVPPPPPGPVAPGVLVPHVFSVFTERLSTAYHFEVDAATQESLVLYLAL